MQNEPDYVLVPVKPTDAMEQAAHDAMTALGGIVHGEDPFVCWNAMIAAHRNETGKHWSPVVLLGDSTTKNVIRDRKFWQFWKPKQWVEIEHTIIRPKDAQVDQIARTMYESRESFAEGCTYVGELDTGYCDDEDDLSATIDGQVNFSALARVAIAAFTGKSD